jgi:hypothetical protein
MLGVLVALVIVHATWDSVEARQLDQTMAAWQAASARYLVATKVPPDPSQDAAPSYRVVEQFVEQGRARKKATGRVEPWIFALMQDLKPATNGGVAPAPILKMGAFIDQAGDAYRALDRAAELEFQGVSAGAGSPLFWDIRSLASFRTTYFVLTNRGDAAVSSLLGQLGIDGIERRPASDEYSWLTRDVLLGARQDVVGDLQNVFGHTKPTDSALAQLAASLAQADEDQQLARTFADGSQRRIARWVYLVNGGERTMGAYDEYRRAHPNGVDAGGVLSSSRWSLLRTLVRPLVAHDLRWSVQQRIDILDAASRPWPGRFDAMASAIRPARTIRQWLGPLARTIYQEGAGGWIADRSWYSLELLTAAETQAEIRSARVAVAIERYRRAHQEALPARLDVLVPAYLDALPEDPFSGVPLFFKSIDAGYVVYSVGQDRRDDGGVGVGTPPKKANLGQRMPGDIGVRIDVRR